MDTLILSCGTGGGHNAAGAAVQEELLRRGHTAVLLNPYTLVSDKAAAIIDRAYIRLAQRSPRAFGAVYAMGNAYRKLPVNSPVYRLNRRMVPILQQYLAQHPCDAVVMPHLYPAEILTNMKAQGLPVPLTFFIATDYVCIPFTEETNCDRYIIPSEYLKEDFLHRGLPAEKLCPLGIPVGSAFRKKGDRAAAREALGLKLDKQVFLVTGGSIGAGSIFCTVDLLRRHFADAEIVVICGNNQKLYHRLQTRPDSALTLLMHTDRMAEYMRACDLMISKPGGLSSTEAAAAGTPLILITPIPGCETSNLEFFEQNQMCLGVRDPRRQLIAACEQLLSHEAAEAMLCHQHEHIDPCAALKICDMLETCVAERAKIHQS